jgi:hypothetical protein
LRPPNLDRAGDAREVIPASFAGCSEILQDLGACLTTECESECPSDATDAGFDSPF